MKITVFFALAFFVSACTSPRHNIAGTTFGWSQSGYEILSDVRVSGLQVRHVRNHNQECTSGVLEHLELNGPIGPDSTFVVEELLKNFPKCVYNAQNNWIAPRIYLNSNGGLAEHGFSLGLLFQKYAVSATITGGQICASACAVAFLGAKYRQVAHDGKLLFHAPYISNGNTISCSNQELNNATRRYYAELLGDADGARLYNRTMAYCSATDGWSLNEDAARIFGLLTD